MRSALTLVLLVGLGRTSLAQTPAGPAEHQLKAWLQAFNSDGRETLQQFLQQHVAPSAHDRLLTASPETFDFRARTGGFDLKQLESATPTHVSGLMQERASDRVARIEVDVESAAPNRITSLSAKLEPTPPALAVKPLSESALVAA